MQIIFSRKSSAMFAWVIWLLVAFLPLNPAESKNRSFWDFLNIFSCRWQLTGKIEPVDIFGIEALRQNVDALVKAFDSRLRGRIKRFDEAAEKSTAFFLKSPIFGLQTRLHFLSKSQRKGLRFEDFPTPEFTPFLKWMLEALKVGRPALEQTSQLTDAQPETIRMWAAVTAYYDGVTNEIAVLLQSGKISYFAFWEQFIRYVHAIRFVELDNGKWTEKEINGAEINILGIRDAFYYHHFKFPNVYIIPVITDATTGAIREDFIRFDSKRILVGGLASRSNFVDRIDYDAPNLWRHDVEDHGRVMAHHLQQLYTANTTGKNEVKNIPIQELFWAYHNSLPTELAKAAFVSVTDLIIHEYGYALLSQLDKVIFYLNTVTHDLKFDSGEAGLAISIFADEHQLSKSEAQKYLLEGAGDLRDFAESSAQ
jgi:hypothetical protein